MEVQLTSKQKIIIVLACSPLIILFAFNIGIMLINAIFGNPDCAKENSLLKLEIGGIVSKKIIKEHNHDIHAIMIKTSNDEEKEYILDIWDELTVGDSLIKKVGSTTFNIIQPNGIKREITFHYNCKEGDFYIDP